MQLQDKQRMHHRKHFDRFSGHVRIDLLKNYIILCKLKNILRTFSDHIAEICKNVVLIALVPTIRDVLINHQLLKVFVRCLY